MVQEIFNSRKEPIAHNRKVGHKKLRYSFEEQFTKDATALVELLAMSPELNGKNKENSDDYFEGFGHSLPVAMYIFRRALGEGEALALLVSSDEEKGQTYYQIHLEKNYTTLTKEIIDIHQKNNRTLQVEDIRIPSQGFIENLTRDCLQEIQKLDRSNAIKPKYNTSEIF